MPYLDYAADAPLRPLARDAMLRALDDAGNPASPHAEGRRAARRVTAARAQVAALVGRAPSEVVWTAGGTEANNLAIFGLAAKTTKRHMVVSAIEHKSVLAPALALAEAGWTVELAPVDGQGVVDLAKLAALLRPDTALVSVMGVNNEVGSIQPWEAIAELAHAAGALFHLDAAQAHYLDLTATAADLITLSSHKLGGPSGAGALIVRRGVPLAPLLLGGAHERGLRAGSLNVAAIAGFGAAAAELLTQRAAEADRVAGLRDRLLAQIAPHLPAMKVLGEAATRAPQLLALSFPGLEGEALLTQLDLVDVSVSTGPACTTLGTAPGHVLPELGLDAATIAGSLRISLGWATTPAVVDEAAGTIARVVGLMGRLKPMAL